jgi:hypothetical protein
MTDPHPDPGPEPTSADGTGDTTGTAPDRRRINTTPRWVKVFGIVAVGVVVLLVIVLVTGQGHGPGRHTSAGDPAGVVSDHTPAAGR